MDKVFAFIHQDDYDSGYRTISIHKTLKGAYKAKKNHRLACFYDWLDMPRRYRTRFSDTEFKKWNIEEVDLKD